MSTEEMALRYEGGESTTDLSTASGIPLSTVRLILLKHGVTLRTRASGINQQKALEKISAANKGRKRTFSEEHKKAISKAALARNEATAKGVSLKPNGYLEITRGPNKGKLEHRVVAEEHLGRPLKKDEVVHHIDRVRTNNSIDNLEVMTRSEHSRLHRLEGE